MSNSAGDSNPRRDARGACFLSPAVAMRCQARKDLWDECKERSDNDSRNHQHRGIKGSGLASRNFRESNVLVYKNVDKNVEVTPTAKPIKAREKAKNDRKNKPRTRRRADSQLLSFVFAATANRRPNYNPSGRLRRAPRTLFICNAFSSATETTGSGHLRHLYYCIRLTCSLVWKTM